MAGYGIGSAVTEREARVIEKKHTTQPDSGAEQKRSVSFSKVCEVITFGDESDKVRYHLFHFYPCLAGLGIGGAVTEEITREIKKMHTTQSATGAQRKRSVSFSNICEVITCGDER